MLFLETDSRETPENLGLKSETQYSLFTELGKQHRALVKLSYLNSSGDVTGLDRFGRVVDQIWWNDSDAIV